MPLRFLLDENVGTDVAVSLTEAGHDIIHTQDVDELGKGSYDHEIAACSKRTGRYILTNDDDLFDEIDDELPTLFYFPNQRLSAHQITSIIEVIEAQYSVEEIDAQPHVRVVEGWIR
jgi:predicted nuclease of predicted toxin-antitoxin system